jgi:hypothetical protein
MVDIGIFVCKQVTMQTVRGIASLLLILETSSSQCLSTVSPFKVFLLRDYFHMVWIHAVSYSTQVVDLFICWYRSVHQFIRESMCTDRLSSTSPKVSVARSVTTDGPDPTRTKLRTMMHGWAVLVYAAPESICSWCYGFGEVCMQTLLSVFSPSKIMHVTHVEFATWFFAIFNTTRFRSGSEFLVVSLAQTFCKLGPIAAFDATCFHPGIITQFGGSQA